MVWMIDFKHHMLKPIASLFARMNVIRHLENRYHQLLQADQMALADEKSMMDESEFQSLLDDKYFAELHKQSIKIEKAFRENHHYNISDYSYIGDISQSQAYLNYYQCYNKMYNAWVLKKRKEENKTLTKDTKITSNRREHNKNIGKKITYEDYQELFNVIQSSYLLMLVNFKQISVKCTIDTMMLLQIVDNKMMDYILPTLLNINTAYPTTEVLLDFIIFHDNSCLVRIKNTVENEDNVFTSIRNNMIEHKDDFADFIYNNRKLIELLNEHYELDETPDQEMLENSMVKTRRENLAVATFTYMNNYNILLEEMRRGVLIGVNNLRAILESISNIQTVAIQKKNETYFASDERILRMIEEQAKKAQADKENDNPDTSDKTNDVDEITEKRPTSYSVRIGENKANYELLNHINTPEELLMLIRKRRLYVKPIRVKQNEKQSRIDENGHYISKKAQQKKAKKERLSIKLINEDQETQKLSNAVANKSDNIPNNPETQTENQTS